MKNCSYESYSTEPSADGTLLYISNRLPYKTRNDLCIYKSRELESIFTEILNLKKTNMIVGCIYCHLHMDLNEFIVYYNNNLLDKLSQDTPNNILGNFTATISDHLPQFLIAPDIFSNPSTA